MTATTATSPTRAAFALAEALEMQTGRPAMALLRWAERDAGSSRPTLILAALRRAKQGIDQEGYTPADFPPAGTVAPDPAVKLFSASEEADWL